MRSMYRDNVSEKETHSSQGTRGSDQRSRRNQGALPLGEYGSPHLDLTSVELCVHTLGCTAVP